MQFFADSLDCLPVKRKCATFTLALGADVNARPTSSLVGIVRVMKEEIGELMLRARFGGCWEEVHVMG